MDGDSLLPLQLHEVHRRSNGIGALDLVDGSDLASVEEHPLREGGLAGVDMRGDADVSDALELADGGEGGG